MRFRILVILLFVAHQSECLKRFWLNGFENKSNFDRKVVQGPIMQNKNLGLKQPFPEDILSKKSIKRYLVLRKNVGKDDQIIGSSIKKMSKQNLIEINKLLSMLKKNRNPSLEDLEKYRNLQRIIFSYGR